jgi:hypothetical protein
MFKAARFGLICGVTLALFQGTQLALCDEITGSVHIGGAGISGTDWTVDLLKTQFANEITPIDYTSHGQKHIFHCISLLSLLKAAGVPVDFKMDPKADPKTKSYPLRFALAARGRDGYIAAFSLAELLPDIGNHHVWVALDEDGQDISEQDGPIRLLAPDDAKPARGVHQLAEIDIVDMATATTRPAAAP